jgi:hypothetical protein
LRLSARQTLVFSTEVAIAAVQHQPLFAALLLSQIAVLNV